MQARQATNITRLFECSTLRGGSTETHTEIPISSLMPRLYVVSRCRVPDKTIKKVNLNQTTSCGNANLVAHGSAHAKVLGSCRWNNGIVKIDLLTRTERVFSGGIASRIVFCTCTVIFCRLNLIRILKSRHY